MFLFRFYRRGLLVNYVEVPHFNTIWGRRHWTAPRAQNSIKTNVFLTFQKSLRGPLGRLRAAQRASPGAPFGLGARPRGALGRPEIPDRTPWAPRWGPGGGEQGLWRNQTRIYSGQGFQNKKTLPVRATDTFFQEMPSRASHSHFFF